VGGHYTHSRNSLHKAQVLVVVAAGNDGVDDCKGRYDSTTTFNQLMVGATTSDDAGASVPNLYWASNYGACVHVQVLATALCTTFYPPAPLPQPRV